MAKRTLLSWSSGKDSAWALHILRTQSDHEVAGLVTTVNETHQRVAMHAVRMELLQQQANASGLELHILNIPDPCSNEQYESVMRDFIRKARHMGIEYMAFGDLFLEDVRKYREDKLSDSGITPIFPLWQIPTDKLVNDMLANGVRAYLTCIDPRCLPSGYAGRELDSALLDELPAGTDPCGENGEFHTFVFDGPMFNHALDISVGEIVERDGFVFADLEPDRTRQNSYDSGPEVTMPYPV